MNVTRPAHELALYVLVTGLTATGGSAQEPPLAAQQLCVSALRDALTGECLEASAIPTLGALYPLTGDWFVDGTGRIGMGTTSPEHQLHVVVDEGDGLFFGKTGVPILGSKIAAFGANRQELYLDIDPLDASVSERFAVRYDGGNEVLVVDEIGNVGIGAEPAGERVRVSADASGQGVFLAKPGTNLGSRLAAFGSNRQQLYMEIDPYGLSGFERFAVRYNASNEVLTIDHFGNMGVGTTSPGAKLDVAGDLRTEILTITGGSDLAERFDSEADASTLEPGTVVVIDAANPGDILPSSRPYDATIAGVIAGAGGLNPGLALSQEGIADGDVLVSMTGRAFVRCTAENGAIAPGDLLTSSSAAGAAMRATDRERSFGAVLGKALTPLDEGTGLVLTLVNLQ